MLGSSSVLILGSDLQQITAVATQFKYEADFDVIQLSTADSHLDQEELERIDALLILPDAKEDKIKFSIEKGYRGPIIGLGVKFEGLTEQLALPVKASFLVQRVKSHIRNFQSRSDMYFSVGPFKLYPASRSLISSKGDEQKLTDKEVEILRFLHRARGEIVAREELLTHVWGYHESVTTHTLETHIYRIRQKIETNADIATILLTESGGYRLAQKSAEK